MRIPFQQSIGRANWKYPSLAVSLLSGLGSTLPLCQSLVGCHLRAEAVPEGRDIISETLGQGNRIMRETSKVTKLIRAKYSMRLAASQPKPNGRGTQAHSDALRKRTRISPNFIASLTMPVPNTTCCIQLDGELVFIDLLIIHVPRTTNLPPITIDIHLQIQFKSLPAPDYPYAKHSCRPSCLLGLSKHLQSMEDPVFSGIMLPKQSALEVVFLLPN